MNSGDSDDSGENDDGMTKNLWWCGERRYGGV